MWKEIAAGAVGVGVGVVLGSYLKEVKPPGDHAELIRNIVFTPPMPEAQVRVAPVYVGEETFKNNPAPTKHSGWLIIEDYPGKHVYQAIAFVDIWTVTPENAPRRIYTVEIAKLERISISFTVFGRRFSISESKTVDVSGSSPGYWLAQVTEAGEIGEFV